MKKHTILLLLCLLLAACAPAQPTEPPVTETQPPATETSPVEATVPTTAPVESHFHIPGLSVEDVVQYFNEVCLDAEIVNSGDATLLQKWAAPIRYRIVGEPTPEDRAVVEELAAWLNTVEGFPGMSEATDETNLWIYFVPQAEFRNVLGEQFSTMDGAVTFWYDRNEIYDAIICVRTDVPQNLRNSVILEEIYNGLGPIQDTTLRPDSIIWAEYAEPQSLTEVDQLILRLLYHPNLTPGMDAARCEAVIRQLYE